MKINEVINVTADQLGVKYYQSSFDGGQPSDDNSETEDKFSSIVNVSHININPETIVQLVKNNKTIVEDTWQNVIDYLRMNFDELTGDYRIVHDRHELYSFRVG